MAACTISSVSGAGHLEQAAWRNNVGHAIVLARLFNEAGPAVKKTPS